LQAAAKTDPPEAAVTTFPAVLSPSTPMDCSMATSPPGETGAITDISQEPKLEAAMPVAVKPAAVMAKVTVPTEATAPTAAQAAISAVEPAIKCYFLGSTDNKHTSYKHALVARMRIIPSIDKNIH